MRIEDGEVGGPTRVSLRERDFRKVLRDRGAARLADAAGTLGPLFKFLWSLRTPIVHREGLSGTTYLKIDGPGASESRLGLTQAQVAALDRFAVIAENAPTSGAKATSPEASTSSRRPSAIASVSLRFTRLNG